MSSTYSEVLFVALGTQHAMCKRHFVIGGLSSYTIYFHINSKKEGFFEKKSYWTQNVCFDFLYNFCLKHFSF